MKKLLSILLVLCLALSLGAAAFASGDAGSDASGEASSASSGGGGGALPSGGGFGDVTTGVVNNTVVLIQDGAAETDEDAADIFQLADGGVIDGTTVSGLYLMNESVYNYRNEDGTVAQGITGVTFVDTDGFVGGEESYYAVDEAGDPMSLPTVSEGNDYNTVIILDDGDDEFSRSGNEIAMGAALAVGGDEEKTLTVENTYLWVSGYKRTTIFADDNTAQLVVRDSRLVCPGSYNYKLGWQALYGGSRCTLLQNGDCWFYNSQVVTEGWGGLAIDSSPDLDLYAVNTEVDVLGGGYVSYTPGDGSINFYGVRADSAQYGVFVTGNSTACLHSMDDLDEAAMLYMTDEDADADPVTEDGRTVITADYAAYLTHQGGGNSTTTEAYLFAENTVLSTENAYTINDNSHFLNDTYGGTSWFWTELWRGSTCVARSTNATFEFDNVELISRTGVIFRTVVNWEGADKSFSLEDGTEAVGNTLIMRNMDVTGDIRNDDIYRNLTVDVTDTTINGAMVSTTIETWNDMWTVEALEQSQAYADALEEMASWEEEVPNPTYDVEYPYADADLDLEAVSGYLTMPDYSDCNGICLTLNDGAVWNVTGDSQLKSLTVSENAEINAEGFDIYVNCSGFFDITTGEQVESLDAGTYENVVFIAADGAGSGEANFNSGADGSVAGGSTTVLKGAALLDSAYDGEVLDVLVQDGMIVAVGEDLEGDEVIDLTGYTLMPGLIDSHVHVAGTDYNLEILATWCSQGVTSVRELGMLSTLGEDEYYDLVEEANADNSNATLVTTGKYLDVTGGYGMGPTGNMGVVITSPEEAAEEVEHKAELGYPQVKIGINSDTDRMTPEEFTAVIEAAHENGMTVSAHINTSAYLEELLGYGLDEAAHTPSDEMSGELIDDMVVAGVAMNTSGSEDAADIKVANLSAFYEAGGLITVGTDLMRNYDTAAASLVEEMRTLIDAGLTVQEVITCATHNNAQVLGLDTGDIAAGLEADLIAVEGTVDESLDALESVDFVMNNGEVVVG